MKLFYRKLGQGKPIFILHGLFGLSDNWNTVGKLLSDFFSVYLVDLRNHGNSPHSEEWTYPAMAHDVLELMQDENLQHIILLGHSLGGKVAMHLAAMHPEKVEKLIVADMAPKDYPGKQFDFTRKLLSINIAEMKSRKEIEIELKKIIKDEATIQLLLKNVVWKEKRPATGNLQLAIQPAGSNKDPEILSWKFNLNVINENQDKIGSTFIIRENIPVPALFIRGERSNYILDSDVPQIKKYFPNSEIKTIAGAGHWVHADKPEAFSQAAREFISE